MGGVSDNDEIRIIRLAEVSVRRFIFVYSNMLEYFLKKIFQNEGLF